ncbi:hypothetical protein HPB47_015197 [Ixodes persulcatus]|uniref:Uncharacterized protein n=1 Tax=Ixodes persulcatus TaxID=34615 RepID=A0AC60QU89_IXOPE|nr:hypothetical protein HPB47_015197 [Ixodes persulcatus]
MSATGGARGRPHRSERQTQPWTTERVYYPRSRSRAGRGSWNRRDDNRTPEDFGRVRSGRGGRSSSHSAQPPPAGPKPLEEPKKKMRSAATWTVVSGRGSVGYASHARWRDQYRPSRGANPSEVRPPFRGLTLADRDDEPPAVYTAEEGKLHTERDQRRKDAAAAAAATEGDIEAALKLLRRERPELLTPAPVLVPPTAPTPPALEVPPLRQSEPVRPAEFIDPSPADSSATGPGGPTTRTPPSPSLMDVDLDSFLAASGAAQGRAVGTLGGRSEIVMAGWWRRRTSSAPPSKEPDPRGPGGGEEVAGRDKRWEKGTRRPGAGEEGGEGETGVARGVGGHTEWCDGRHRGRTFGYCEVRPAESINEEGHDRSTYPVMRINEEDSSAITVVLDDHSFEGFGQASGHGDSD